MTLASTTTIKPFKDASPQPLLEASPAPYIALLLDSVPSVFKDMSCKTTAATPTQLVLLGNISTSETVWTWVSYVGPSTISLEAASTAATPATTTSSTVPVSARALPALQTNIRSTTPASMLPKPVQPSIQIAENASAASATSTNSTPTEHVLLLWSHVLKASMQLVSIASPFLFSVLTSTQISANVSPASKATTLKAVFASVLSVQSARFLPTTASFALTCLLSVPNTILFQETAWVAKMQDIQLEMEFACKRTHP